MCSACAKIKTYLHSDYDVGIAGSKKLYHDADAPPMKPKCTDLIKAITHTSDFIEVQIVESVSPSTKLILSIV